VGLNLLYLGKKLPSNAFAFMLPFKGDLWAIIVLVIFVTGAVMWFLEAFMGNYSQVTVALAVAC
jgi:hypothetical protein